MERDPVEQLRANASDFAKLYRDLFEAMVQEGVPEERAQSAASNAAMQAILMREALREPWDG